MGMEGWDEHGVGGREFPGGTYRAARLKPDHKCRAPLRSRRASAGFLRPAGIARHPRSYGRKVAAGEWRDYAISFTSQKAVFSVYRRTAEFPLYRIEKNPKTARKQGLYSVIAATGLILKRGHDLKRVINVLEKKLSLVSG